MCALRCAAVDHVPCCFMSFTALRRRVKEDMYALVEAEQAMGLDSMLFLPAASRPQRPEHPDLRGLPVRFSPNVETRCWREEGDGGILQREFRTQPACLRPVSGFPTTGRTAITFLSWMTIGYRADSNIW